jgi:hypothetical protein
VAFDIQRTAMLGLLNAVVGVASSVSSIASATARDRLRLLRGARLNVPRRA